MTINILHIAPSAEGSVRKFIKNNINNISAIRMDLRTLMSELDMLGVIDVDDQTSTLITLRKITNRMFNNNHTRSKMPISSPEYISSFVEDNVLCLEHDSYLKLCYHYSIPIFISDVGSFNDVACSDISANAPLLSSGCDWMLYKDITYGDVGHYVFGNPDDAWLFLNFYAGIDIGFPDYSFVEAEDIIDVNNIEVEKYVYDRLC